MRFFRQRLSSFQIIIFGFLGVILVGTVLLLLPISTKGSNASFDQALFTSTSAVCVTGLVVKDTAMYWSAFGQAVILVLIQIGGLGIITVAAFIAMISGRKISLLQRSLLQDSLSTHQLGGTVKMTGFIFKVALTAEAVGAAVMMPTFCGRFGMHGVWMSVFHSVSAFCNAGFDIMGDQTGEFSSLSGFTASPGIVIPICLLIITGGIGFLTWDDLAAHRHHFRSYRMQTKVVLVTTLILIVVPTAIFVVSEFSGKPVSERIYLSIFQAVTPRTAGFNTADIASMSGVGTLVMIVLMLIGGSPGSTAGGMKTSTIAVLYANVAAVFERRKSAQLFGRRIEDGTIRNAATLFMMYLSLPMIGALIISLIEKLPIKTCFFETVSAIGTVGLSLGITPSLSFPSHLVLILLMFLGRVGGLTLVYAAVNSYHMEPSQRPVEKIIVG
ncbi:MAG: Trk family potassium uptake protein [Lachnospiraceae bacterium]|nr:Trk family potassium uptake protein [Lachnospiraceae bacterium]